MLSWFGLANSPVQENYVAYGWVALTQQKGQAGQRSWHTWHMAVLQTQPRYCSLQSLSWTMCSDFKVGRRLWPTVLCTALSSWFTMKILFIGYLFLWACTWRCNLSLHPIHPNPRQMQFLSESLGKSTIFIACTSFIIEWRRSGAGASASPGSGVRLAVWGAANGPSIIAREVHWCYKVCDFSPCTFAIHFRKVRTVIVWELAFLTDLHSLCMNSLSYRMIWANFRIMSYTAEGVCKEPSELEHAQG